MSAAQLVALIGLTTSMAVPSIASADEPGGDGVYRLPVVTVYGRRPARPSVIVELTRTSAAHEAGVAHEGLRESLIRASMPPALRAVEDARAPVEAK